MSLLSGSVKDKFEGKITEIRHWRDYLLENLLEDYQAGKNITVTGEVNFKYFRPFIFPLIKVQRTTKTNLTISIEQEPKYRIDIKQYHTVPVKPAFSFEYVR
jgi:hypothetical protein